MWQRDERIIAQLGDAFQCHVASALNRPFVALFKQNRSDEASDGIFVREDAEDFGAPLDLAV
jgi:ADP-heptose:LPS heptosyltransferase